MWIYLGGKDACRMRKAFYSRASAFRNKRGPSFVHDKHAQPHLYPRIASNQTSSRYHTTRPLRCRDESQSLRYYLRLSHQSECPVFDATTRINPRNMKAHVFRDSTPVIRIPVSYGRPRASRWHSNSLLRGIFHSRAQCSKFAGHASG